MTDRRSGQDRRALPRGGRRITDLAEVSGWVTLTALCDYFAVDRRTLVKLLDHTDVPIVRLGARSPRVHVDDAAKLERALRGSGV
jgi:hypothetical protein